jgi:hypothetical protein
MVAEEAALAEPVWVAVAGPSNLALVAEDHQKVAAVGHGVPNMEQSAELLLADLSPNFREGLGSNLYILFF